MACKTAGDAHPDAQNTERQHAQQPETRPPALQQDLIALERRPEHLQTNRQGPRCRRFLPVARWPRQLLALWHTRLHSTPHRSESPRWEGAPPRCPGSHGPPLGLLEPADRTFPEDPVGGWCESCGDPCQRRSCCEAAATHCRRRSLHAPQRHRAPSRPRTLPQGQHSPES